MRNEIQINQLGRPINNYVFVEIQDTTFQFKRESGIVIQKTYSEDAWSDAKGYSVSDFMPRSGIVAAVPNVIYPGNFDYKTELEIEVGDEVFWSAHVVEGCAVLVCAGKKYLKIDYHHLLARRRDNDLCPINGYVLFKADPEVKTALAYTETKKISDKWDIAILPEKLPVSLLKKRNVPMIWEEDDRVLLMVHSSPLKLESSLRSTMDIELYAAYWWMCLIDVEKL